ncbi:MAG: hypothetical protein O7E52_18335 [Candidatus Poribacteria bacterium]|nr:hypothetical protein [Candidatus Poribacteria bacterium]
MTVTKLSCLIPFYCFLASSLWSAPVFRSTPELLSNPNPAAPLAGVLSFKASGTVHTKIIGSTEGHRFEIEYGPEKNPINGLPVVGMRADKRYTVTVHISDASGQTTFDQPLSLTTRPLPNRPDLMPRIKIERYTPEAMAKGFTLTDRKLLFSGAAAEVGVIKEEG